MLAVQDSFTHLEDLSLHALDLISPYDIRFIGNHMAKRSSFYIFQVTGRFVGTGRYLPYLGKVLFRTVPYRTVLVYIGTY